MIQNAIVIRRTTQYASDLKSGALILNNGQWGFATSDKLLVLRDLTGAFHEIPTTALLPSLMRVKNPCNDLMSMPSPAYIGDLVLVKSENAYYFYDDSAWIKLADYNLVNETMQTHLSAIDPHNQYVMKSKLYHSTGPVFPGCTFIDNGNGNVTINSCKVRIYNNDNFEGELFEVTIPTKSFNLIDGVDSLAIADYNNGVPEFKIVNADLYSSYNFSSMAPVYRLWYAFGEIHSASVDSLANGATEKTINRIAQTEYYARVNNQGLILDETVTRIVTITSALVWAGAVITDVLPYTSDVDNFSYLYKDALGVWQKVVTTLYPNNLYNPASGLATLTNPSKYTALYIYRSIGDKKESFCVLDSNEYNTLDSCKESQPRTDVPNVIKNHCLLVGRILIQNGASSGLVQSSFTISFGSGGVSDHESLTNLQGGASNDHSHLTASQADLLINAGSAGKTILSDINNFISINQIPASLLGAVRYQGTWNASTNTPTLSITPDSTTKGYYYIVSVQGSFNGVTYRVNDMVISSGSSWQKVDNNNLVTSVFGRTGPVTAQSGDYDLDLVDDGTTYKRITSTEKTNYGTAYTHSQITNGNPHGTTIANISGLSTALDGKEPIWTRTNITSTTDWNTLTLPGSYRVDNWTGGTNGPTGAYGWGELLVSRSTGDDHVAQMYLPHRYSNAVGNGLYARVRYGTWSDWRSYADSAWVKNVCPQLSTGFSAGTTHVYRAYNSGKSANVLYFEY